MHKKPKWAPIGKPQKKVEVVKDYKPITFMSQTERVKILKRFDELQKRKDVKQAKRRERINLMKELRARGFTLEEIGVEFSLTRERVRQILKQ